MPLPFFRKALLGSVSPYALTLRMAGGFNKRAVIWQRRIPKPETTDVA
jgi:hypothetical protein